MTAISIILSIILIPSALELLLTTAGSLLSCFARGRITKETVLSRGRMAVIVPAHDEELLIARCVGGLKASAGLVGSTDVVVIADNCSDQTALVAAGAGARVIERMNPEERGKGPALDYAFKLLAAEGYEYFCVVDADTVVESNLVLEMHRALACEADVVQARYLVHNHQATTRSRLMNLAFSAFNAVRPRGRRWWGVSAGLMGNGFALRASVLERVPYLTTSLVEDLAYHLDLVLAGFSVVFIDSTTVRAEVPITEVAAQTQRARWEGGRLNVLLTYSPRMLHALTRGRWTVLEPMLDLACLPLAYVLGLVVVIFIGLPWVGGAFLGILAVHVVAAFAEDFRSLKDFRILLEVPRYVLWKLTLIPKILRRGRSDAAWERTGRDSVS